MAAVGTEIQFKEVLTAMKETLGRYGYRKRGNRFRRVFGDVLATIDVQRWRSEILGAIRFTVNVGIVSSRILQVYGFGRTLANADCGSAHVHFRIGHFMPVPEDKWWELDGASSPADVVVEILPLLTENIVPYLEQHSSEAALVKLWESKRHIGCTERQRIMYLKVLISEASV